MDEIVWTQQSETLWTGRCGGKPVGTIEHGRRFTFVDVDGTRHGAFRDLSAAQAAARALCFGEITAPSPRALYEGRTSGRPSVRARVGF